MIGNSSTRTDAYQSPIYDSGFFLLPATITGSVISLDSSTSCNSESTKNYNEIRVYQTPNLFQLDDINVTIETSPTAIHSDYAASNLITSLDHRSTRKGQRPYKAGCSQESYETCFITNRNTLKTTSTRTKYTYTYDINGFKVTDINGFYVRTATTTTTVDDHGIYVLGFDLGASKFQHSVLVVQTMIG